MVPNFRKSVERKSGINEKKKLVKTKNKTNVPCNQWRGEKNWAPLAASIPLNDVSKPQDSVPDENIMNVYASFMGFYGNMYFPLCT